MSHVPYASVVGILMYAMICTRLDITHVVGVLSRYMSKPRNEHWTSKEGFQVFVWHYELWIFLPRKTRIGQSVGHTWLCE
jgi:hypothetical protein